MIMMMMDNSGDDDNEQTENYDSDISGNDNG